MFAQHYSCSVHMLYPLVILWRGCVIETFSQNWRTLIYDKRISWRRNQSKSFPSSKTTQRTAILSDVPRPPSLFSCFFHATTKPNYEERLPQGEHTMPKHRCPYPKCRYKTEDVKVKLATVLLKVHTHTHTCKPLVSKLRKQQLRSRKCGD